MHIEKALSGVPMESRCSGWRTGKCLLVKEGEAEGVKEFICETCGQGFQAPSAGRLEEVMEAHYKLSEGCRLK
ncbi:hypothetical protein TrRE_jg9928 [Triparma retinervis]|uniref:Uncharacterized protein n=1 Tax=Triparma retinervis TaxID=2557542 RepID=A0A9W6ZLT3_9STRA|nr:hypothetical protein TrRE_jg9928 [Triparma retinervis]